MLESIEAFSAFPIAHYANTADLNDVTTGNTIIPGYTEYGCGGDCPCTAKPGYDGPTGKGTPNGLGAF